MFTFAVASSTDLQVVLRDILINEKAGRNVKLTAHRHSVPWLKDVKMCFLDSTW
jgi:hypothetical protein